MNSHELDAQLVELLRRHVPHDDSYRARSIILSDGLGSDVVRLIFERAKLKIIDAADSYFRKPEMRVPFEIDPFDVARLVRQYVGISDILSVRPLRVADLDFQVHKHAMIQQSLANLCRTNASMDEDMSMPEALYFDGFEPADYGLFYSTTPPLAPLVADREGKPIIPSNSFSIVNLFDSSFSITSLYLQRNADDTNSGTELFLIIPYDQKMWTVTSANVTEGSYSFQWVSLDTSHSSAEQHCLSALLPVSFFDTSHSRYELRIRPYHSNKFLHISRDEFIAVFAHGGDIGVFPENRRTAHGFAEVSIIKFYPVLDIHETDNKRIVKRVTLPYNKRYVRRKWMSIREVRSKFIGFATAIEPPTEYVIDDKLFDKTRKAAIQTRVTRNYIVPLIYHLFAHSAHIVFNGAIVTLQKVMSPQLVCELTEFVLSEVIPIKLKILQAGNALKARSLTSPNDILNCALKAMFIYVYQETSSVDGLTTMIFELLKNPSALKTKQQTNLDSRNTDTIASTSLAIIEE